MRSRQRQQSPRARGLLRYIHTKGFVRISGQYKHKSSINITQNRIIFTIVAAVIFTAGIVSVIR